MCGGRSKRPWASLNSGIDTPPRIRPLSHDPALSLGRTRTGVRARLGPHKKGHAAGIGLEPDRGCGVAEKTWGVPAMPSAAYFRRQADICLSLIASDEEVSNRLIIMAREYAAKADAVKEPAADPPPATDRAPLPDLEENQTAVRLAPNAPEPSAEC